MDSLHRNTDVFRPTKSYDLTRIHLKPFFDVFSSLHSPDVASAIIAKKDNYGPQENKQRERDRGFINKSLARQFVKNSSKSILSAALLN